MVFFRKIPNPVPRATEPDEEVIELSNFDDKNEAGCREKRLIARVTGIPAWRRQMRSNLFRSTGLLVLTYALLWFPYNLLSLISFLDRDLSFKLDEHAYWLKGLILLNAVLNPLLYRWNP